MVVFQNNAQPKNVSKVINRGFEKKITAELILVNEGVKFLQ